MMRGPYGRKDRLIKERHHDAYHERGKLPEHTQCGQCGAVFANGRWSWKTLPEPAHEAICPACRRVEDNYPAGYVDLKGTFLADHYQEIMNLILNEERREREERPLERIIMIVGNRDRASLTTTGVHIARRIGEALSKAYSGKLTFQYAADDQNIRVLWQRGK